MESNVTRILVIEPNPDVRVFLARLLRRSGYEAIAAADCPSADDLARRWQPAAILVDVSRPYANPQVLREQLRVSNDVRRIPRIALTSQCNLDAPSARALGFAGFLNKPFHISDLLDELARLVEPGESESAA